MHSKCLYIILIVALLLCGCSDPDALPDIAPAEKDEPVALINQQPITQQQLQKVLLPAYGKKVLGEMIQLEIVRQAAKEQGVTLTEEQIKAEFDRLLHEMAPAKPRHEQLALLDYLLESRRLSREEFEMIVERQALLRQMIDPVITITEEMIESEYHRQYDRKVLVRQIVAGSFRTIQDYWDDLKAGADLIELIQRHSEDQPSTARDGLLGPYTRHDEAIPEPIREAAFKIPEAGRLSPPVRFYDEENNEWWAVLRLEKDFPARDVPLAEVRAELKSMITNRLINERMLTLQQKLQKRAYINITHPRLR